MCHAKGGHRGHRVVDFEDALTHKKLEWERLSAELSNYLPESEREITLLRDKALALKVSWGQTNDAIRAASDAHRAALAAAEQAAMEAAERLVTQQDAALQARLAAVMRAAQGAAQAVEAYKRFSPARPQASDMCAVEAFLERCRGEAERIRALTETPFECCAFRFVENRNFVFPKSVGTLCPADLSGNPPPPIVELVAAEANALRLRWGRVLVLGSHVTYVVSLETANLEPLKFAIKTELFYVTCLRAATEYVVRVKAVASRGSTTVAESAWSDPPLRAHTLAGLPLEHSAPLSLLPCKDRALCALQGWLRGRSCELLYRGSRDGFAAAVFHAMCDGMGPTLTLFRSAGSSSNSSSSSAGCVFGGFTAVPWSMGDGRVADDSAFLFSLVCGDAASLVLFPVKRPGYAVFHSARCGPSFGCGTEIRVLSNMKKANPFCGLKTYVDAFEVSGKLFTGSDGDSTLAEEKKTARKKRKTAKLTDTTAQPSILSLSSRAPPPPLPLPPSEECSESCTTKKKYELKLSEIEVYRVF